MKKIIALILGLSMLFCTVFAMAEENTEKDTLGRVTLNGAFTLQCTIPEGYEIGGDVNQYFEGDALTVSFKSEKEGAPTMQLSIAYDEMYSEVDRMNDLDEEALSLLEESFIEQDPDVEISLGETGYGTLLMIARLSEVYGNAVDFFSIYKGYCVEFVLGPAEGYTLTDEQVQKCIDLLTDLDFVPDKQLVAEKTYTTNLTDYDPETNTVTAHVQHNLTQDEETVKALKVGDTLKWGLIEEEIQTLDSDEEGLITINDDIILKNDDGEYHLYMYEKEYLEDFVTLSLEIPDSLVIEDNVNQETGEPLEEPKALTVEEFTAMLEAEDYPDFATDNVYVTFDENGEMEHVERIYAPWQ